MKIIYISVNSIVSNNRKHDLLQFLYKHNPDVCLLGEIKLNTVYKILFKNYILIKNAIFGGGKTVLITRVDF